MSLNDQLAELDDEGIAECCRFLSKFTRAAGIPEHTRADAQSAMGGMMTYVTALRAQLAGLRLDYDFFRQATDDAVSRVESARRRAEAAESTVAELRAKLAEVMQSAPAAREAGDE